MFLILPIGFLKVFHRIPYVNLAIIAVCLLLHVAQLVSPGDWVDRLILHPSGAISETGIDDGWPRQPWSIVTHAFMHANFAHLIGNMLFLFLFGCGLNADLGHVRYLAFYLLGAAIAGPMNMVLTDRGCLGASGAISFVTGIVAAFYPRNEVRFWYFIWIFLYMRHDTFEVSALWAIAMWFGFDLWGVLSEGLSSGIGYIAHITGYLAGFGLGILMLKRGWFESDGHDIITWYLGGKVAKVSRRGRKTESFIRSRQHIGAPAEARVRDAAPTDWAPIPLADDASHPSSSSSHRPASAPSDAAAPSGSARRIEAFFAANPRASAITEFDRAQVLHWYQEYLKQPTRKALSMRALAGLARSAAAENDVDLAIDAYTRLVLQLKSTPDKQAAVAIQAARFAADSKRTRQAEQYLAIAGKCPLNAKQESAIAQIQARLEQP